MALPLTPSRRLAAMALDDEEDVAATCSRCDKLMLSVWCESCEAPFCADCDQEWHEASPGVRRHHRRNSLDLIPVMATPADEDEEILDGSGDVENDGSGNSNRLASGAGSHDARSDALRAGRARASSSSFLSKAAAAAAAASSSSSSSSSSLLSPSRRRSDVPTTKRNSTPAGVVPRTHSEPIVAPPGSGQRRVGHSVLHVAGIYGHESVVDEAASFASARGSEERRSSLEAHDGLGRTPLHLAALHGHAALSRRLVKEGVSPTCSVRSLVPTFPTPAGAAVDGSATPGATPPATRAAAVASSPSYVWRSPLRAARSAGHGPVVQAMEEAAREQQQKLKMLQQQKQIKQKLHHQGPSPARLGKKSASSHVTRTTPGRGSPGGRKLPQQPQQPQQQQQQQSRVRHWIRGDLLGRGAFGCVYSCLDEDTGQILAVKEIPFTPSDAKEVAALRSEIELMRNWDHRNIVRYRGADVDDQGKVFYIFTEWVPGGSVMGLLQKFGRLPARVVSNYTRQILEGLVYLHEKPRLTAHFDIKPGNVLVDENGTIKLADFGAARKLHDLGSSIDGSTDGGGGDDDNGAAGAAGGGGGGGCGGGRRHSRSNSGALSRSLRGTPYFMAPEVVTGTRQGFEADIWSLGGTVLNMSTGKPPWSDLGADNAASLLLHIAMSGKIPTIPDPTDAGAGGDDDDDDGHMDLLDMEWGEALNDFLKCCLQRDPLQRPKAKDLLEHRFLLLATFGTSDPAELAEQELEDGVAADRSMLLGGGGGAGAGAGASEAAGGSQAGVFSSSSSHAIPAAATTSTIGGGPVMATPPRHSSAGREGRTSSTPGYLAANCTESPAAQAALGVVSPARPAVMDTRRRGDDDDDDDGDDEEQVAASPDVSISRFLRRRASEQRRESRRLTLMPNRKGGGGGAGRSLLGPPIDQEEKEAAGAAAPNPFAKGGR